MVSNRARHTLLINSENAYRQPFIDFSSHSEQAITQVVYNNQQVGDEPRHLPNRLNKLFSRYLQLATRLWPVEDNNTNASRLRRYIYKIRQLWTERLKPFFRQTEYSEQDYNYLNKMLIPTIQSLEHFYMDIYNLQDTDFKRYCLDTVLRDIATCLEGTQSRIENLKREIFSLDSFEYYLTIQKRYVVVKELTHQYLKQHSISQGMAPHLEGMFLNIANEMGFATPSSTANTDQFINVPLIKKHEQSARRFLERKLPEVYTPEVIIDAAYEYYRDILPTQPFKYKQQDIDQIKETIWSYWPYLKAYFPDANLDDQSESDDAETGEANSFTTNTNETYEMSQQDNESQLSDEDLEDSSQKDHFATFIWPDFLQQCMYFDEAKQKTYIQIPPELNSLVQNNVYSLVVDKQIMPAIAAIYAAVNKNNLKQCQALLDRYPNALQVDDDFEKPAAFLLDQAIDEQHWDIALLLTDKISIDTTTTRFNLSEFTTFLDRAAASDQYELLLNIRQNAQFHREVEDQELLQIAINQRGYHCVSQLISHLDRASYKDIEDLAKKINLSALLNTLCMLDDKKVNANQANLSKLLKASAEQVDNHFSVQLPEDLKNTFKKFKKTPQIKQILTDITHKAFNIACQHYYKKDRIYEDGILITFPSSQNTTLLNLDQYISTPLNYHEHAYEVLKEALKKGNFNIWRAWHNKIELNNNDLLLWAFEGNNRADVIDTIRYATGDIRQHTLEQSGNIWHTVCRYGAHKYLDKLNFDDKATNQPNCQGYKPCHLAALNQNVSTISKISKKGSDLLQTNSYDKHNTLLHYFSQAESKLDKSSLGRVTKQLVKQVPSLVNQGNDSNELPSHIAIKNPNCSDVMINHLLPTTSENLNKQDDQGMNLLHLAIIHGREKTIETLFQNGCDINQLTADGINILDLASQRANQHNQPKFEKKFLSLLNKHFGSQAADDIPASQIAATQQNFAQSYQTNQLWIAQQASTLVSADENNTAQSYEGPPSKKRKI